MGPSFQNRLESYASLGRSRARLSTTTWACLTSRNSAARPVQMTARIARDPIVTRASSNRLLESDRHITLPVKH